MTKTFVALDSPCSGASKTTGFVHWHGLCADFGLADQFNEEGHWENPGCSRINEIIMELHGYNSSYNELLLIGYENSKKLSKLGSLGKFGLSMNECDNWVVKNPH